MRKLSKKISMLMVLAMLVSLFSGIVSASAASAWSFKSSKYDVEVGETIEMEKNEYADFDLFKNDAAPEGYTVKWSSSDSDAVWVNAKTGQLRADKFKTADYGDKATISATFTNTATKKSATRSFVIVVAEAADYEIAVNFGDEVLAVGQKYDLKAVVKADGKEVEAKVEFAIDGKAIDAAYTPAAAGEFTIVTTATIDGKVVAEEKTVVVVANAGIVSAKQVTFDTVALTLDSAAAANAIAADINKLGSVYMLGENEIQAFVEKAAVDANNAKVVNVTLFNNLVKDVTYKFSYGTTSATVVGADLGEYNARAIAIATTTVPAWADKDIELNLYNADGILIQVVKTGFSVEAMNNGAYNLDTFNNRIFFHEANAVASVKATYWMGYDDNGNKIQDLTTVGNIASINPGATKDSLVLGWSTGDGDYSTDYSNNASIGLAVDESKYLGFKFKATNIYTGAEKEYKYDGESYLGGYKITFVSSNENVVLVDNEVNLGEIHAVGAGSAQILVYRAPDYNEDAKELLGIFTVNVVNVRILTKLAPVASKKLLSTSEDDSVMIKLGVKDQLGANFNGAVYVRQVNSKDNVQVAVNGTEVERNYGVEPGMDVTPSIGAESGWELYFTVTAVGARTWANPAQLLITVKDFANNVTKEAVVTLSVKVPSYTTRYAFDGVKTAIDTNLTAESWKSLGERFATEVKLSAYDKDGYLVATYDADGADLFNNRADAAAVTGSDRFFYTVKHNGADVVFDDNVFEAVTIDGSKLEKADKGSYSIVAYKIKASDGKDQYLTSTNINVSDSTPGIAPIKKDNKLSGVYNTGDVQAALTTDKLAFKRNGNEDGALVLSDVVSNVHVNPTSGQIDRVNVQSVTVKEEYSDYNNDGTKEYFEYDVKVFMSYEVYNN